MLSIRHYSRTFGFPLMILFLFIIIGCEKNNPPRGMINLPSQVKLKFGKNEPVKFAAYCNDPEDGLLPQDAILWSSSIDGNLGTGDSITKNNLSLGVHTITLTIKDSKGSVTKENLNIEITDIEGIEMARIESDDKPVAKQ